MVEAPMPKKRVSSFLAFEGMTWPNPRDPADVQWRILYGEPDRIDLLAAASFMNAYANLIQMSQRSRNRLVDQIRDALRTSAPEPKSVFDDFDGYYSVRLYGSEVSRHAPSPLWTDYIDSISHDPDLTYVWVSNKEKTDG